VTPNRIALVVGALFAVEFASLTWLATQGQAAVSVLFAGYGAAFTGYLGTVVLLKRHAPQWSPKTALLVLLAAGLLLRVPWLPTEPSLSDDVWRYLHDGRAQVAGTNPYRYPPASPEAAAFAGPEYPLINHPELTTIYPPAAQLAFRLAIHMGGTLLAWKMLLLLIDLAIGAAVVWLLRVRGHPAAGGAIYLLHPLPVIEFAGNGHVDALGILGLVVTIALVESRRITAGVSLALSIATKYLALPLIPFAARGLSRHNWLGFLGIVLATLALLYAPFLEHPPLGSLGQFARTFEFNGPIYSLLRTVRSQMDVRIALGVALLVLLAFSWRTYASLEEAAFMWLSGLLLLSPIVHPWYIVWLIPFLAWRGKTVWRWEWWALAWSGTIVFAYAVLTRWRAENVWELPQWALMLEYGPVYLLLAVRLVGSAMGLRGER
jgi:hypothetical protein